MWQFESSGRNFVQSLYAIVSDRGVKQVFTHAMWKIKIPSKVHIFLWLLTNNKVLIRDNLAKRRQVDDLSCLFCSETESISHLFFECCVAKVFWQTISEITNVKLGSDFESVAKLWINQKRHGVTNVCAAAGFLSLWKLRNELCFQEIGWTGMDKLLRRCARMMREWRVLNNLEDAAKLETWASELERRSFLPPRLDWCQRPPRQDYTNHPDSGVGGERSVLIVDDAV
jgi:hypothetical protein